MTTQKRTTLPTYVAAQYGHEMKFQKWKWRVHLPSTILLKKLFVPSTSSFFFPVGWDLDVAVMKQLWPFRRESYPEEWLSRKAEGIMALDDIEESKIPTLNGLFTLVKSKICILLESLYFGLAVP